MPSKSKKQHNLMTAVAHNPAFAKKVGIPVSVGKDFSAADKGKKFGSGGRADLQKINEPKTKHGQQAILKKGENIMATTKKMAKGGMAASAMGKVKTAAPSRDGLAIKGKTKGKQIVMKKGGKC
jgi:hypothetical protein